MIGQRTPYIFVFLCILFLVACTEDPSTISESQTAVLAPDANSQPVDSLPTVAIAISAPTPEPTATIIPPTPTPSEPLAALVNDEPVFLAAYEKELARYEQAQAGLGLVPGADGANYRALVLDALIEQKLITQSATSQGVAITLDMVDNKLAELRVTAGETGNFEAWLEANQWTENEFREALQKEMLVEQVVAQVTADVPFAVEQVRARYIQINDLALAQELRDQLLAGADFAFLAQQNSLDRVTAENGGDLGFFARGSLLVPQVEEVAFMLQPNETSDLISVVDGSGTTTYYLVQVLERDPQRPLTADMRYALLQQAFENWLNDLWNQATITRFVDTGS